MSTRDPSFAAFTQLVEQDPYLRPYIPNIMNRLAAITRRECKLLALGQSLVDFASAHEYFGLHKKKDGWVLREWAPHASGISLIGDFSSWREEPRLALRRITNEGVWELSLPHEALQHEQHYKLMMHWWEGDFENKGERLPAYVRRVTQDPTTKIFSAQVWDPPQAYQWKHPQYRVPSHKAPRIYEAHVGMAQEEGRVGTYEEFTNKVLPRIAEAGYNTIQLMAIQEHPYYGSFGYQVSNFFAPSSRCGTPEDLCELIDTAHGLGIAVVMDIVHSHAVKNEVEGLSRFDGSYDLYFHAGPRGEHSAWQTRCFHYGKTEVLHFLLSNCRYWLDAFHFDGYRFDGVTSMLYADHGLGCAFDNYGKYFDGNVDLDALVYLALAAKLVHALRPDALVIAEDMSGMPGLASTREFGGLGFDYRLAMGIPDFWIKTLKHAKDEDWNVSQMWHELTNRRADEQTISYAESHDQALVGDKTVIFWLADKEMYENMALSKPSLLIDRALALHKMIRLITYATCGRGYLNFIGNEFGHPEWIDFPREGNNWSYHYARRQWSLRDNKLLRYAGLAEFDRAMMRLGEESNFVESGFPEKVYDHVANQILVFKRAEILFAFNFNPTTSFPEINVEAAPGRYRIVLDSDAKEYLGHGRVEDAREYQTVKGKGGSNILALYLPTRSALVLQRVGDLPKS